MYTYRVTKYNPQFREEKGAYTKSEWTQFGDIGKSFEGHILTENEYMRVEDAYVAVLTSFLKEAGVSSMRIDREENAKNTQFKGKLIHVGEIYDLQDLAQLFRLALRGQLWCKFKNEDGSYVDFGWDYYSYIGIPAKCEESINFARQQGLYVEDHPEPILD